MLVALAASPVASAQRTDAEQFAYGEQIGRDAYVYGLPLLEFLRVRAEQTSVRAPDPMTNAPVNVFGHAGGFARPEDRTVVAPNVDTLYSIAHLDLGREPMVISHPNMGSRYFVFELLDPWTNVVDYVGSRTTGSKKGRFAIVWTGAPRRAQKVPKGVRVIKTRYRRLWVIGRTLADDTAVDIKRAKKLMAKYELAPASKVDDPPRPPRGRPGRVKEHPVPEGMAFLDALAAGMKANPPPARDRDIVARLADSGIVAGGKPSRDIEAGPFRDGLVKGLADTKAKLPGEARSQVVQGAIANAGWYTAPAAIGDYGRDFDLRAAIAIVGLGANTPDEAVYPTALTDSTGALLNGATGRYRITFPEEPPNDAFWSLTMYDIDGFLVDNDAKRYAVGDSHPPLVKRADGSVVIAIQHDKPAEADVNWLPAPSALFRMSLRIYEPRPSVLDGTWKLPAIERLP